MARNKRNRQVTKAINRLEELKAKARSLDEADCLSTAELNEVKRCMRKISKLSPQMKGEIVNFLKASTNNCSVLMAPFEAEWQLVYEEKCGRIDGILTTDSDAIVLGAENMYIDMSMAQCTVYHYSRDTAIKQHKKQRQYFQLP